MTGEKSLSELLSPAMRVEKPTPTWQKAITYFSPEQGWILLILLILAFFSVASVIDTANWVETPGLYWVIILASLTGQLFSRIRLPSLLIHPLSVTIGLLASLVSVTSLIKGVSFNEKIWEVCLRLDHWYEIASGEGMNTDLLPYSALILFLAWLMSYTGTWWAYRHSNIWLPIVVAGVAILTSLSFLPAYFTSRFYIFVFLCILLVAQMTTVKAMIRWKNEGTMFSRSDGWGALHSAFWFSAAVLLIAAILPLYIYVSGPVASVWKTTRTPIAFVEDEMTRLLGNVPSRKEDHGRFFGRFLPFIGSISFRGESVLWTESDYPSYWTARTYSVYTSQGWIGGKTRDYKISSDSIFAMTTPVKSVKSIQQVIQMNFPSERFVAGGIFEWASEDAVLGILEPLKFEISLENSDGDIYLPADIRNVAGGLRDFLGNPDAYGLEKYLSAKFPDDIKVVSIRRSGVKPTSVLFERIASETPDIVEWNFDREIPADKSVNIASSVSVATDEDLRESPVDYSGFIRDHYLQLPYDLPKRIKLLTDEVTMGSNNPFDKSVAVEGYLRTAGFTYSQDIGPPPLGSDGVEHFLFVSGTGYSDYFASAMAVMLRTQGIPARLAAGYSGGIYDPQTDKSTVLDSDSHGWVQVYFPDYGWIDFEPTPEWDRPAREMRKKNPSNFIRSLGSLYTGTDSPKSPDDFLEDVGQFGSGNGLSFQEDIIRGFVRYGQYVGYIAATIGLVALMFWLLWNLGLQGLSNDEKLLTKSARLAVLAGITKRQDQTSLQFMHTIGQVFPETANHASTLGKILTYRIYGNFYVTSESQKAWTGIRNSLIKRTIRRTYSWALKADQI